MTTSQTADSLRARRRLAEEWLMESSGWRDNLDDVQAQRLMNQARNYVNKKIAETAVLADDAAEAMIDEAVTAVLRIMHDINKLTPQLGQLDEESAHHQLQTFSQNIEEISLPAISQEKIEQILGLRQAWDKSTTFNCLHQLIIPQIVDQPIEEEE